MFDEPDGIQPVAHTDEQAYSPTLKELTQEQWATMVAHYRSLVDASDITVHMYAARLKIIDPAQFATLGYETQLSNLEESFAGVERATGNELAKYLTNGEAAAITNPHILQRHPECSSNDVWEHV